MSGFYIAIFSRLTRAAMLEVTRQDFVRTAEAKGLHPWTVNLRHVLRNALIPVTTVAGTVVRSASRRIVTICSSENRLFFMAPLRAGAIFLEINVSEKPGRSVLVLLLLVGIFYYLGVYWDSLEPGTTIRVGLLGLAGIYGLKWAFMSRRHQLTFHLHDGSRVRWRSRSGDFKYKERVASRAVEHLRELGLLARSAA